MLGVIKWGIICGERYCGKCEILLVMLLMILDLSVKDFFITVISRVYDLELSAY